MPLSPGYKAAIPADCAGGGVDMGVVDSVGGIDAVPKNAKGAPIAVEVGEGLSVDLVVAAARGMAHATSKTSAAQVFLRSAFQRIWNFLLILVYQHVTCLSGLFFPSADKQTMQCLVQPQE